MTLRQRLETAAAPVAAEIVPAMRQLALLALHSSSMAHLKHFAVPKHSTHKGWEHYYEGVGDLVDKLIETFQGEQACVVGMPSSQELAMVSQFDPVELIEMVAELCAQLSTAVSPAIANILQELEGFCDQSLYVLRLE
jgi:hypothetical protein